ncbi:MAG: MarR family transcriptional regulator [Prevotella sp.]|nr:MarR family transcriptional regulator [Prevotella sp.]
MNALKEQMTEINRLCNESDEIYHCIAQSYGLSDSVYWILYVLYDSGEPISQSELCSDWCYSKQTVNSSVASMIKKEWITLETIPGTRNKKKIVLTRSGKRFCQKIIGETRDMEQAAFSKIPENDLRIFISSFHMINKFMREEYEKRHTAPKA